MRGMGLSALMQRRTLVFVYVLRALFLGFKSVASKPCNLLA